VKSAIKLSIVNNLLRLSNEISDFKVDFKTLYFEDMVVVTIQITCDILGRFAKVSPNNKCHVTFFALF